VSQGLDLIWYGDSISEAFRGTGAGRPCPSRDAQEVWRTHYASKYRNAVFACAWDKTNHLLWRLQHGEAPEVGRRPNRDRMSYIGCQIGPNVSYCAWDKTNYLLWRLQQGGGAGGRQTDFQGAMLVFASMAQNPRVRSTS
jgi:hypothetical protein